MQEIDSSGILHAGGRMKHMMLMALFVLACGDDIKKDPYVEPEEPYQGTQSECQVWATRAGTTRLSCSTAALSSVSPVYGGAMRSTVENTPDNRSNE